MSVEMILSTKYWKVEIICDRYTRTYTYHEINKRKVEIICDRYTRTYTHHEINKRKVEILCDRYTRTYTAGKPVTQESSLDVFCHVIFDVNIDVMDVLRNL
jgi:hypothetical protein